MSLSNPNVAQRKYATWLQIHLSFINGNWTATIYRLLVIFGLLLNHDCILLLRKLIPVALFFNEWHIISIIWNGASNHLFSPTDRPERTKPDHLHSRYVITYSMP